MRPRGALVLCLPLLVVPEMALAAPAPKKVHVAAGVDLESEQAADRYLKANLPLVQQDLPAAIRTCARSAPPSLVASFEFAVEVGKGGKPGRTVATPANSFTGCVTKAVAGMKFSEPPRAPLGVYFEVAFGE